MMKVIIDTVLKAGNIITDLYHQKYQISYKSDQSPVTEADLKANDVIIQGLKNFDPSIPVISEESEHEKLNLSLFWLVDPLDGTREFIKKNGEFTVNVALIENQKPIHGIVYAPVFNKLYYTDDQYAYLNDQIIHTRKKPSDGSSVLIGRNSNYNQSLEDFLATYKIKDITKLGSSLKICYIAEGKADLYPRLARTMEWDTAAGHAILLKSGGDIINLENYQTLTYSKKNYENPDFLTLGDISALT